MFFATSNIVCAKERLIILIILYSLALPTYIGAEVVYSQMLTKMSREEEAAETIHVDDSQYNFE